MIRGKRVCVIGAGIIGASSAYALSCAGARVTLIDKNGKAGEGDSKANGAQLCYSHVEPLASPESLRVMPSWLLASWLGRDSPLKWSPRADFAHWRWLVSFVSHCRWKTARETTRELLRISMRSRDLTAQWISEFPASVRDSLAFNQRGKLVVYRNEASRQATERQIAWQNQYDRSRRLVEPDECVCIEPALGATGGGRIAYGVWNERSDIIDAAKFARALASASGAETMFSRYVSELKTREGCVQAALLSDGSEVSADHFVVAAGPHSMALVEGFDSDIRLEPIKGYSVTLRVLKFDAAPKISMTDLARKVAYSPLDGFLRVVGYAELSGWDRCIDERRIENLCNAVRATFPGACGFDEVHAWAGLRPATPGGLPCIGRTRVPNLWVNVGHGGLGLTLAAGSAAALVEKMRSA